ncbi:MAG: prolipoprotein diacylglyceryl transferase [Chloroflexi bacterium]|nr:prolipoprotein diacylglyceryl transferase [Chloroflexota bacterium]
MQPNPVLFRIGSISIYWYGVLIVLGSLLATQLASNLSRRNGHDPEIAWNMLVVLLICGVVGGRIYHVISAWEYYRANPNQIVGLQMSGFGIFGAVIGGALALAVYSAIHKLRFWEWADYLIPGVLLAQAIGRWGNFFNQELYGYPSDLPWAIYISPEHRLPQFVADERFHPTFLYESLLNLLGFLLLYFLARKWVKGRKWGDIFLIYGLVYPLIRFVIEFQRPDAWMAGTLTMAQVVSIVIFAVSLILLVGRRLVKKDAMNYVQGEPWVAPDEAEAEAETEAVSEDEVVTDEDITDDDEPEEED